MPTTTLMVAPAKVLEQIAAEIPPVFRGNLIVVGSLAAGYHFFGSDTTLAVRTKDADCLLAPRIEAVAAGTAITEALFDADWQFRADDDWPHPGDATTSDHALPAVRLNPPGTTDWFIELLTVPETTAHHSRQWMRIETTRGHFGLPSFRFLGIATFEPRVTPMGIYVAQPLMMALANLLEHPSIGTSLMSLPIEGRYIKRSNKDLGRVLAVARLAIGQDEDALLSWPAEWERALQACFPADWPGLASRAGQGLQQLLDSPNDLDEARHTCQFGLLASKPPTSEQLRMVGLRLQQDAIDPLAQRVLQVAPHTCTTDPE